MNRYQVYSLLGKILALDALPSHRDQIIPELKREDINWQQFVSLADQHLVLQTLYPKIRDHEILGYVPHELSDHLKYIFDLTTTRNLEVINQAGKLNKVLRNSGITPLFMKGVGNILDGLYKYPGERILHDIDILVQEDSFEKAAGALLVDGYHSNYKYNPSEKIQIRHYPILYKPGEPLYLELHRMPVGLKYQEFFNTELVFSFAKHPISSSECLVMSDEHKIIHNFIHAQLDHRGHIYALEYMRNLYDLLLLSERTDPVCVMNNFGHYRRTFPGYLDICNQTFGIYRYSKNPKLFLHLFRFRYFLNMRSRLFGMTSLFLIRVFLGYFVTPLKSLSDSKLRYKLKKKLQDPEWYKKQRAYYKRVFRIVTKKK